MKSFVLLLTLLFPASMLAVDIDAPKEVDPYTLVRVSTKEEGTGYAWFVIGPDGFADAEMNNKSMVYTGRPGVYRTIVVISDKDGKLKQGQTSTVIRPSPGPAPGPGPSPPPGPGPGPTPVPTPTPTPLPMGFAADVLVMLKATPTYNKEKALAIAECFASIGGQGSDPARSMGWDLQAFSTNTKELIKGALTTEEIAAWNAPFFKPLATKQSQLFQERGLKTTSREEIAKLWKETAQAIKDAVAAYP